MPKTALIVGAGDGISASFARLLANGGAKVGLAARNPDKLTALQQETGAVGFRCDAAEVDQVARLFTEVDAQLGAVDLVLYNPSTRARGPFTELDPEAVKTAIMVTAYGGFLVAQQAISRMLRQGGGTLLFTGASASVKGYPHSTSFAMGKFALRGLAQSLAREFAPQNIHVAHFVIDGAVRAAHRPDPPDRPDTFLDPDAIAEAYLAVARQPRSAWTWELELRPWVETF